MNLDQKTFHFYNWTNPLIIFCFIIFCAGAIFLSNIVFGIFHKLFALGSLTNNDTLGLIAFTPLLILCGLMCFMLFMSGKIVLNNEAIEFSSIFKNVKIVWQNVKSIGICTASKYSNKPIELINANKFIFQELKYLFICTEDINCFGWGQRINEHIIYVQYRPEIISAISIQLKQNSNDLASYIHQNGPISPPQAWRKTIMILLGLVLLLGAIRTLLIYPKEKPKTTEILSSISNKQPYFLVEEIKQIESSEKSASPVGGKESFQKYVDKNLIYPKPALQLDITGAVKLSVVIEKDGSIGYIRVLRGIGAGCDEATLILMKEAPNWIPASNQNIPIAVTIEITFWFMMSDDSKSDHR